MIPLGIDAAPAGELRQLADDLFWARFDLPFRLNHINLYMLDTADGWVLIDTGLNNQATAAHWQLLLNGPLAGQPVVQIIVTHHHVDHIGYAGPLAALTGADVFASRAEAEHARSSQDSWTIWNCARSTEEPQIGTDSRMRSRRLAYRTMDLFVL